MIVVSGITTPKEDTATGLYGTLNADSNKIQELIKNDAANFDLTSFVAATSLTTLTLKSKEYSALNFPGKLLFEITTTGTVISEGSFFVIRFPGYYDN